ncbi:MAG: class II fructose-1,6-bisphosphate aldolase [Planctomycetes bacterium]|nr:class II fructose-1,6-bisphosphate aldolase [Planctomycetota bacterium]
MPLVPGKKILEAADKGKYAIGAFNINNMEIIQGVLKAAVAEKAPVFLSTSEGAVSYAGLKTLVAMVRSLADEAPIPVALHLDHGKDLKVIQACVDGGFTSVMIDGSEHPFAENLKKTKQVVELAHKKGVSVEAELGRLVGVEDNVSVAERDAVLVDPAEAEKFAKETGIDSLAPAVGTSHGAFKFKGDAKLDFGRLAECKKRTGLPLVLHGASGVPDWVLQKAVKFGAKVEGAKGVPEDQIKGAIANGVCKINIDTDLRLALIGAIREVLQTKPSEFDPRKVFGPGRDAIEKVVREKFAMFGCAGKA